MVKCSNCGLDVGENFEICPNCGNNLSKSDTELNGAETSACANCGVKLKDSDTFCPSCGTKVEIEESSLRCENCGNELSQNAIFCQVCGKKVEKSQTSKRTCPNCGKDVDDNTAFCQECGANIFTGEKNKHEVSTSTSFSDKINLNSLVKPSIIALVVAICLSIIGLLIGFSWFSFVLAIILSVGFFAAAIDNEANAIVFGFIVSLILGIIENPLVEFVYGAFVAGFYDGFFGGHLVLIVFLGVVISYISNVYFKENILNITHNFYGKL